MSFNRKEAASAADKQRLFADICEHFKPVLRYVIYNWLSVYFPSTSLLDIAATILLLLWFTNDTNALVDGFSQNIFVILATGLKDDWPTLEVLLPVVWQGI